VSGPVRLEAVDGDRRVVVEFDAPTSAEAAGFRAMFSAVCAQMFRSARMDRAVDRMVGEAGDREGPTVTTGATSPTTEHVSRSFEVETTFGTPVVEGEPTVVDGPFVPFSSVLVEVPVGAPVGPAPPVLSAVEDLPEEDPAPVLCATPTCPLLEGHDGDCGVSPIAAPPKSEGELTGRDLGAARGGAARGQQKAAEKARRMALFVEAYRMADGSPTERVAAGAKAADLAIRTANRYLREARDAGLIDVPPSGVRPATGDRSATPFRPPVRERATKTARPTVAPLEPGERLTPEQRMDRFVEVFKASALTGDKRVEQAAKAAGLATFSGESYLRRARKLGLLPDPLGAMARAAGPITGGVA